MPQLRSMLARRRRLTQVLKATRRRCAPVFSSPRPPLGVLASAQACATERHSRPCRAATGRLPDAHFQVVLKRITVRGSIVGTRHDLDEAIAFAAEGKALS